MRGSAKPSRLWETEETGQAWLRGRGGGAPHSQGARPEPFSLLGAGAPSGVRDFSPTPSRPRKSTRPALEGRVDHWTTREVPESWRNFKVLVT